MAQPCHRFEKDFDITLFMTLAEVERVGTPVVSLTGDKIVGMSSPIPISLPFDSG